MIVPLNHWDYEFNSPFDHFRVQFTINSLFSRMWNLCCGGDFIFFFLIFFMEKDGRQNCIVNNGLYCQNCNDAFVKASTWVRAQVWCGLRACPSFAWSWIAGSVQWHFSSTPRCCCHIATAYIHYHPHSAWSMWDMEVEERGGDAIYVFLVWGFCGKIIGMVMGMNFWGMGLWR